MRSFDLLVITNFTVLYAFFDANKPCTEKLFITGHQLFLSYQITNKTAEG